MYRNSLLVLSVISSLLLHTTAQACDDKACESAYLSETKQHIANQIRRAESYKSERHAYSAMRKRKAYAFFVHQHLINTKKMDDKSI